MLEVIEDVDNNVINTFKEKEFHLSLSFKTYILQLMIKYRLVVIICLNLLPVVI